MPNLIANRYGKAGVRVLKILKNGPVHRIKDIEVAVLLAGDFGSSYTASDNTKVVPTDTVKNTINVLAKTKLGDEIERFGLDLGSHFLDKYPQVSSVDVHISERSWQRMEFEEKPHPHSFLSGSDAKKFTHVVCGRDQQDIESGIRDLIILKSTGSGFESYPKDEFTTLRETSDRILATSFSATWTYSKPPRSFGTGNGAILSAMLKIFAENYSPSAQATLFQMGEAALASCADISQVNLAMPNKHCLLIDLSPFGMKNENEVFVPTDEPHGQIEATVTR
jgi:urate oxidase